MGLEHCGGLYALQCGRVYKCKNTLYELFTFVNEGN